MDTETIDMREIEASNQAMRNFEDINEAIQKNRNQMGQLFWEMGWALSRMQRACVQCLQLPEPTSRPIQERSCPECGGALGLYQLQFASFEDYLEAVEIPKSTAYKWISIHDQLAPTLPKVGQALEPYADEREQRRAAKDLIVSVGWTKLNLAQHRIDPEAEGEEIAQQIRDIRDRSKDELGETDPHASFPFREELEGITDLTRKLRSAFKRGDGDGALHTIQAIESRTRSLYRQVDAAHGRGDL